MEVSLPAPAVDQLGNIADLRPSSAKADLTVLFANSVRISPSRPLLTSPTGFRLPLQLALRLKVYPRHPPAFFLQMSAAPTLMLTQPLSKPPTSLQASPPHSDLGRHRSSPPNPAHHPLLPPPNFVPHSGRARS